MLYLACLDIRSSKQLNALQAIISSLSNVQALYFCIGGQDAAEKEIKSLGQLKDCFDLLDINLPGLYDEIDSGILDEILEIHFISTSESMKNLPVTVQQTIKRRILYILIQYIVFLNQCLK